jgi:hypothetical protein
MPEQSQQPPLNPSAPPSYNSQAQPPQGQYPPGQFRQPPPIQGYAPQNYPQQRGQQRFNQPGNRGYVDDGSPQRGYRGRRGSGGGGIGNFATGMLVGGALGGGMRDTFENIFHGR